MAGRPLTKKQRRRQAQRLPSSAPRPWWQAPYALGGGAAAVVALIVVLVVVLTGSSVQAVSTPTPVPASVLAAVTNPSASLLTQVGRGGQSGELSRLSGSTVLKDSSGRPEIIFVGAEYCPYCAAERWTMIMALSRFGTFTGLKEMSSTSNDVDPDTSTFTFLDATYSSQWIDFSSTELYDRNDNPLQTPDAQVEQIFTTYDQPPYTASNGYPFLYIAGRFVLFNTSYDPAILQGLSWKQIAADLGDPTSNVTQAIVGNANYLTAAICLTTGNQPASVCESGTIQGIEAGLNAQATVGS
ncbi:MAG: DUF929 family protein [Candidatus Dormibacteria bacterium]